MDQLPRLGKRELICLLLFTCNYVVSVWRGFLFLWVLWMGYVILLWHLLSLSLIILIVICIRYCMVVDCMSVFFAWIVVERINSRSVWSTFPRAHNKYLFLCLRLQCHTRNKHGRLTMGSRERQLSALPSCEKHHSSHNYDV